MLTSFIRPAPDLAEVVAGFRQRVSLPGGRTIRLALPARPELFVEFYFGTPYRTRSASAPATVLVGPSTSYHTDIELGGDSDTFTIKFQPTAMQRLFGLPGSILVDLAEDAPAVESGFRALRRLLDGTQNFGERIAIAQDWLRGRLASVRPANAIDRAARLVRRSSGQIDLDRLAQACAMSPRNFRRCFADAVGVSPKLYSRITRLHAALELKDRQPDLPWTHVSQRLGYFDQSHMLRDMRVFAGGMDIPGRYKARSSDAVSDISYSPRQS